jgi:hypothetical protein
VVKRGSDWLVECRAMTPSIRPAAVAAALAVERLFQALGLVPEERNAKIVEASVTWNYTTILNIIFIMFAAVLVWRFVRTRGLPMLRMMNKPMSEHA